MTKKIKNLLFLFLGFVSLALGLIGIILPLLPSTPFFLLSAWLFLNSSKKAHDWLYRQPVIGIALKNWEQHGSISKKNKILAITMILFSILFIIFKQIILYVKIPVIMIMLTVCVFIISRPSAPTKNINN